MSAAEPPGSWNRLMTVTAIFRQSRAGTGCRTGTVDKSNERPQLKRKSVVVAKSRIEREPVLVTNCQSATGQIFGEVEHGLHLPCCESS